MYMFQNVSNLGTKKDKKWKCECGKTYKYDRMYYRDKKYVI